MTYFVITIFLALSWYTPICSDFFSDAWDGVKSTAEDIGHGFEDAGKWIGDRFHDTKPTRAIDYAARLAAFETALHVATAVLDAAKFIADQTLEGAYQTANGSLKIAEHFLDDVVQNLATGTLRGPKLASQGILEGAKHASVGVLEGGRWLTNQSLGQIDITCIHYDGNVQDLIRGNLGNVEIRGKILVPFKPVKFDLDISNPIASVTSAAASIGKLMESVLLSPFSKEVEAVTNKPLNQALNEVQQGVQLTQQLEQKIQSTQVPSELIENQNKLLEQQKQIEDKKKEVADLAFKMQAVMKEAAAKSYDELLQFISSKGTNLDRTTVAYRQQYAKTMESIKKKRDALKASQPK